MTAAHEGTGKGGDRSVRLNQTIFLTILLVAAALRLQDMRQPLVDAFSWREASTAMMADNFYQTSWNIFFPEVNWTGPGPSYQGREFQIFSYLVAILHWLFGWHDWFGRLVAAGFGLITVFSLHRLTQLVWDQRHAHAVALCYAILPAAVMMDSSFLPDPAMLAFVTLGVWLFVRFWLSGPGWLLPVATAAFTLGALAKLPGLSVGLVVAYLFAHSLLRREAKSPRAILLAMLVSIAVVFSYYAWALYLGKSYPPFHTAGSGYVWDMGIDRFLQNGFYLADFWDVATWWFYGYPLLFLVLLGIFVPLPRPGPATDPALIYLPHVWLGAVVVLYLVAAREITNNPWNLHVLSVPFAFFAGRGAVFLVGLANTTMAKLIRSLVILAAVLVFSTLPLVANMKRPFAENAYRMGDRLRGLIQPEDLVVLVSPDVGDPIAIYYSRTRGWVFPQGGGQRTWSSFVDDDTEAIAQFEALKRRGARWFGFAKNARDDSGRRFVTHHAGFISYLDATAWIAAETEDYAIYRLFE